MAVGQYFVRWRVQLEPRHRYEMVTTHSVDLVRSRPATLEIRTVEPGEVNDCTLDYCDENGESFNHLHCDSLRQAFEQAQDEFSVAVADWLAVDERVEYEFDERQAKLANDLLARISERLSEGASDVSPSESGEAIVNEIASLGACDDDTET